MLCCGHPRAAHESNRVPVTCECGCRALVLRARQALINDMVRAKTRAFRLNLPKTGHALDVATTAVGWEIDEQERRGRGLREPR